MENIGLKGRLELIKVSPNGSIQETIIPNTIVTVGKSMVAGLMVADVNVGSRFDWIAIGVGSNTIAAGNTTLGSEYMRYGLGNIIGSTTTTSVTNDTAQWIGSFGIISSKTVNEAGIFNKSGLNTGSMLARTTFTGIACSSGDTLRATWRIQVS